MTALRTIDTAHPDSVALRSFAAIGTICHVLSTDPDQTTAATRIVKQQLVELDEACSRFRPDSELSRLPRGDEVRISPLLSRLLGAAIRTAHRTDGLVDPTVEVAALGYDRDLDAVRERPNTRIARTRPAPGAWRIMLDEERGRVVIPEGIEVDLGASAKAWAADRAARTCHRRLPGGFCINLGGDIATAGPAPDTGWRVAVDDATEWDSAAWPVVALRTGGMATSSTAVRTWRVGDRTVHHIVDPRTGEMADPIWRAVSVVARTAELANAASTAAIVLGTEAPAWLARHGLHSRLMSNQGLPVYVGDWPWDEPGQTHE